MKKFGVIGVGGYVAPRHMKAIKDTGNIMVTSTDKNDSVGIIDSFFPESRFYTEIERFERDIYKKKRTEGKVDYISVCSPNYLHDSHIRIGLRNDCDVICEKPLVVNGENIKYLKMAQDDFGKDISCILQMRLHEQAKSLFSKRSTFGKKDITLDYITSRGQWYNHSWKAEIGKSGGLAMNIGIHLFDMLIWIFGDVDSFFINEKRSDLISGELRLDKANVRFKLSTDYNQIPKEKRASGFRTYRNMVIGNDRFDFTKGFEDLHTKSYLEILNGKGFTVSDCEQSIFLANGIMKF
jgi:UDP-N-acetyl-2-amino-2-deoxyglucuronate dehydrogenase